MEKNPLLLPGAIVASGALIGAGLFFGLRAGPSHEAPSAAPSSVEPVHSQSPLADTPGAEPSSPPAPPPPGRPSRELEDAVQKQAREALEKHRARIVAECWDPSFKKDPTPPKASFVLRFMFDSKGQAFVTGAGAPPEASRADVSQCLRDMKLPLSVRPPGMEVGVQLELTLPR